MWIYLNDRFVKEEEAVVSVFDHGGSAGGYENTWGTGKLYFGSMKVKNIRIHNRPAYTVTPGQLQRLGSPSLPRPPIGQTMATWYGISTGYPSPTPFGLGLGPD